ncbi:MAG: S9 family peptidase, partial [Bacteroidales bacterium]|nr:S9 family peptidase [Bacteroidales bacterium]
MKHIVILLSILLTMGCTQKNHFEYPETKKVDVTDNYFGTEVPDPYRWLEDDMSEETAAWVEAQNKVTYSYLESIPFADELKQRLTEIWNYPKMGIPNKENELYFYSYNTGLQNQSVLYVKKELDEEGTVFLDPNTFSEDGTIALSAFSVSNDGKYAGYGISRAGSDWQEFFVREIETGKDLDDHLMWIKSSGISWLKNGFFYSRYDKPAEGEELKGENKNSKVFYHHLNIPQSEDILVYKDEAHPYRSFGIGVTEDEAYMILHAHETTSGNAFAFRKAGLGNEPFTWLEEGFDHDFSPIGNVEHLLYVHTNMDAPRYQLIVIDLNQPERDNWKTVIP